MDGPTNSAGFSSDPPASAGRVLLVDDEPVILLILAGILQDASFECVQACGGEEALRAFASAPFDLVITDRTMPGMDGLELTRALKSARPSLPVILISGMRPQELLGPSDGGADAFLGKPFTRETLLACVVQVMCRS